MKTRSFWLTTVAAVFGVAATLALGVWQLSRAAQKDALQAAIAAQRQAAPLSVAGLVASVPLVTAGTSVGSADAAKADALHRAVVLRGTWMAERTVFLDNRQMGGKPGFYVLTPLRLQGQDAAVVVQRGWVQRNFLDRTVLPVVATPVGMVEISGRMAPPPAKLYDFKGQESGPIRQNLGLADFSAETRLPLLGLSVLQTDPSSDGLLRDWPEVASGIGKHYGYAFQWFALSGLMAVLYVWFQFIAPRRRKRQS